MTSFKVTFLISSPGHWYANLGDPFPNRFKELDSPFRQGLLRRVDSNHRSPGYEPSEIDLFSTARYILGVDLINGNLACFEKSQKMISPGINFSFE